MSRLTLGLAVVLWLVACGRAPDPPTRAPLDGAASAGGPAATDGCRFRVPFSQFKAELPDVVGECIENARVDPVTGDSLQRTTNGLLVLRKADNRIAFTDGAKTWVRGPSGIETRANWERFAWEPTAVPTAGPQSVDISPSAATATSSAPPAPQPVSPQAPGKVSPTVPAKPAATATLPPARAKP